MRDVGQRIWGHGRPATDSLDGLSPAELRDVASLDDAYVLRGMYQDAAAAIPTNKTAPVRVQLAQKIIDAWGE